RNGASSTALGSWRSGFDRACNTQRTHLAGQLTSGRWFVTDDRIALFGRAAVEGLVLDLMSRTGRDHPKGRHPTLPILLLVGPRGAGKTAVLNNLAVGFSGRIPFARFDFGANPNITARQFLTFLAFELHRWNRRYGRLTFPRYLVGELALNVQLHTENPTVARNQMRRALEEYRQVDELREFLKKLAKGIVPLTGGAVPGAEVAAEYVPNLLLGPLLAWRPSRRLLLGKALDWYGDRPGAARDPLHELVHA